MATATLAATNLLFTTNGSTTAAKATASANTITLEGASSANVNLAGVATPSDTDVNHATTVGYVLAKTNSPVHFTDSARVSVNSNITIASPGAAIDGVTLSNGDKVLLRNQTTTTEEGLYVFNGGASAMTRNTAEGTGNSALNDVTFVTEGSDGGFSFIQTSNVLYGANLSYNVFAGATPAAGANSNIQINNNGTFDGATNFNIAGSSATKLSVADSSSIAFGAGDDFSISHDGTNTVGTTATGNFIIDNTNASGRTIMRLGSDTNSAVFRVENNSGSGKLSVDGTGKMYLLGHAEIQDGIDIPNDNKPLRIGASDDITLVHDATDSSLTSSTGNFSIVNENATGETVMKLGSTNSSTEFSVQSSNGSKKLYVDATGATNVNGTLGVNGITSITNSTQSTSSTTGCLVLTGGLGVAKDTFIAGNAHGLSFHTTSDATLKTQIKPLNDPLSSIRKIEGYSYKWKQNEQGKDQYGVLAQDLTNVPELEDLVSHNNNGKMTVNYNGLVAYLIGAVKQLTDKIDNLENGFK